MRALLAIALVGCTSPAILGGPTPATTTHPCDTGGSCPTGWDCPSYANPSGPCQAPLGIPEASRHLDAGGDAR